MGDDAEQSNGTKTTGGPPKLDEQYRSYTNAVGTPQRNPTTSNDGGDEKEDERKVSVLQLYRYADKTDVLLLTIGLLGAVAAGMALPGLSLVFGAMLGDFICFATVLVAFNSTADITNITCGSAAGSSCNLTSTDFNIETAMETAAIRFSIIGFGAWVASYIYVALLLLTAERQSRRMREAFFRSIMRQEMAWFDTNDSGELATRMADDIDKIFSGMGDKVGSFIQWTTTFLGGLIVGLIEEWRLALVILAVTPLVAAVAGAMSKLVAAFTAREQKAYAKAGSIAEEVLMLIRTVVAFGGEDKETDRYQVELDNAKKIGNKKSFSSGMVMFLTFFIIFGSYALAFWYAGVLIRDHGASGGQVMTTFFSVMIGAFALGYAGPNAEAVNMARGAAVRVFEIEDRVSLIDPMSDEGSKPEESTVKGTIEFRDVHFNYPARPEIKILRGLNLRVGCGETMALVGPSGCGKSTVIQLIQRFYDPLKGAIILDGHDVKALNVRWLREHVGVVSQEPVLFATTIRENIRYGRDNVSDEEIIVATKAANAHDFISKLPKKYDTLVGERGAQLSGGQKQRIAIARALVRNPKVLLLDEATSALDTESEKMVQDALDKAREGRTTIVIAHRLSTIRNATTITAIVSGQIVEQGTHAELMERKDIYYELVMNQQVAGVENETEDEAEEAKLKRSGSGFGSQYRRQLKRRSFRQQTSYFSRQGSVISNESLRRKPSRFSSTVEEDEEDDVALPPPGVFRVAKMNSPEWPYFLLGAIGAAGAGVTMPVFSIIFANLLEIFSKDCETMKDEIAIYAPVFAYIGLGAGIFEFSKVFFFGIAGESLTARLRRLVFRAMLRQEIGWFDDPRHSTGALTTRLAKDASEVKGGLGSRMAAIFQLIATLVAALLIAFIHNWEMTLVTLGALPLIAFAGFLQTKALAGHAQSSKEMLEEAGKVAVEGIDNIRTVAQLTKEELFWKRYHDCLEGPYRAATRKAHFQGLAFGFSQAVIYFAYAGSFRFGGWQVANQDVAYRDVFIVFGAIVFSAFSVGQAMSFAPDYSTARVAAARVFDLLDTVPMIDSSNRGGSQSETKGRIRFNNVKFSYPSRAKVTVLDELNITAEPGQTVALVGSSGCGKSTCIQLLERFYDAKEGAVMIDDVDVKEINLNFLRRQLGLVSQEPVLFDCSIAENIAYGDNSRLVTQEEVEEAARKANIHNFIDGLPQGYDTGVGDKGTQLSGGQKQRIAIARALVRNPKILLLDEATSALDTESEKIVQEALDEARQGRTSIVIAHRLSTIQSADKIIAMQNGQVVEQGTHDELLHKKGFYYRLSQAQVHNVM